MNAVIVLLVGLAAGLGGRAHHRHHHAAIDAATRSLAAVAVTRCEPKRGTIWVTDLTRPDAHKWIVQRDGTLCNPTTGRRVAVRELGLENH